MMVVIVQIHISGAHHSRQLSKHGLHNASAQTNITKQHKMQYTKIHNTWYNTQKIKQHIIQCTKYTTANNTKHSHMTFWFKIFEITHHKIIHSTNCIKSTSQISLCIISASQQHIVKLDPKYKVKTRQKQLKSFLFLPALWPKLQGIIG